MRRRKRHRKRPSPTRHDLLLAELVAIVERAKSGPLSETDYTALKTAVDTLAFLTQELAGTALFAAACLDGDPRFPIIDAV